MKIHITNQQKDLSLNKSSLRALVKEVLDFLNISCDEIGFHFVTEKVISKLHDQFFEDPTPTDCITFPIDASYLGDVFVCPAVAITYAKKRDLDPYRETALYIVHGILHLIGYDDNGEAKRTMRKKEKSCMHHLDKKKLKITH